MFIYFIMFRSIKLKKVKKKKKSPVWGTLGRAPRAPLRIPGALVLPTVQPGPTRSPVSRPPLAGLQLRRGVGGMLTVSAG